MSAIITNPSHKLENSIYLVFSASVSSFFLLASMGFPTSIPTDLDFTILLFTASVIGGLLVYISPDKRYLEHKIAGKTNLFDDESKKLIIYGFYVFKTMNLPSVIIRKPISILNEGAKNAIKSRNLAGELWQIRGTFWFVLTMLFSFPAILVISSSDTTIIGYIILTSLTCILLLVISLEQWKNVIELTTILAEFHWFDVNVTRKRRSEITSEPKEYEISVDITGIIRSIKGENPEKTGPKGFSKSGIIVETTPTKWSDRQYSFLVSEECKILREFLNRSEWESFKQRFQSLKKAIIKKGEKQIDFLIPNLMFSWADSWKKGKDPHGFIQLRRLAFLMLEENYIPSGDIDSIRALTHYSVESMCNPGWSKTYIYKLLTPQILRYFGTIANLLLDYAKSESHSIQSDYYYSMRPGYVLEGDIDEIETIVNSYGGPIFQEIYPIKILYTAPESFDDLVNQDN